MCLLSQQSCNVINTEKGGPKYVKGTVLDSLTSLPIDSVKISTGLKSDTSSLVFQTYTDSNGQYLFFVGTGTNSSGLVVIADKSSYQKQKKEFSTALVDTAIVNFKLLPN